MKADNLRIFKVFSGGGDIHYLLPHFQREYAWTEENWSILLKDTLAIYEEYQNNEEIEHFLGSLVVVEEGMQNGMIPVLKLVDGQQRITTISLMLCAIQQAIKVSDSSLALRISRFLLNEGKGDFQFKLLPTTKYGDREAYKEILQSGKSTNLQSNIPKAFNFFYKEFSGKLERGELDSHKLFEVIVSCFQVVFIILAKTESPYKIFESLNAKNKRLSQADLVRNYIAMRLPGANQEKIFNDYWSKIEDVLQEVRTVGKSRIRELTGFIRHYLSLYSGILCNEEHIYARFRDRMQKNFLDDASFVEELKIICRFATYYDRLLRPEKDPKFNKALTRLNTLEYSTTFPFLLKAYDALESNVISTQQFQELLEVLENFMIRRWLVGEPTNYLNRVFPTLWKDIDVSNFSTSLRQLLATKSYPNDQVVEQKILERKLYSSGAQDRLYLLFETIERQLWSGSGGFASLNANATIEHIMPQSIANKIAWQQELGDNWQQVHDKYLDTLGNLTLVTQEWNSVLSNRAFVGNPPYTEQDGMSGKRLLFTRHAYRLNNHYFVDILKWDETAIIDRAKYLSEKILEIWPALAVTKPNTVQYGYPERLLLADTQHPVKSWRDVTTVTMDYLISKGKFEILKQTSPLNFQVHNQVKLDSKSWRPLSNGWMVYVNLSIKSACTFYEKMLTTSGVSLSDWELVVKENGSISPIPITLPLE